MASTPADFPPPSPTVRTSPRPSIVSNLWRQFWRSNVWVKLVVLVALTAGIAGAVGSVIGSVRSEPPQKQQARATVEQLQVPAGQSLTPQQQVQLDSAKQQVSDYGHWFYDKTAPTLWRVGFGYVIFFVLGMMARTFVKTLAVLAAVVLVGVTVAAYFKVLDLGQFRDNMTSSAGWAVDQAKGLKDLVVKTAGFSLSGVVGFVVGFLRK